MGIEQECETSLKDMTMFALDTTILLRSKWTRNLMLDAIFQQEIFEIDCL